MAEGHTNQALTELRRGASLAPPIEPREYLARALERAGQPEEALALYQQIVASPAAIWPAAGDYDPGLWTASMLKVAELAARAGHPSEASSSLKRLLTICSQADPDSTKTVAAHKLLTRLSSLSN